MENQNSGIIKPVKFPAICQFCGETIYRHNEAEGRFHFRDGKIICAKCRVTRSKRGQFIQRDLEKRIKRDLAEKDKIRIKKADENLIDIGLASQSKTDTKIKKRENKKIIFDL